MTGSVPRLLAHLTRPLAIVATALLCSIGLAAIPAGDAPEAEAASGWDFDAGYIISDSNFYDSNSMDANSVQAFLNAHVPTCHPEWDNNPNDITCLKDYWTQTTWKSADAYCSGYDSTWQSAAQIIDGVARSCGISQKVLLVTLQKENALVDHAFPSSWRYRTAMGYGCPDGAACDAQYFGLFNQIYNAARQFKIYAAHPSWYRYRAGQNNYIQWNPDAACGGSTVYIRNQATASLYNYTPYQPNNAAKAAGYGLGDGCSSYGNRNFFLYYSDWFGSPAGFEVKGDINAAWQRAGSQSGVMGYPIADEVCDWTTGNTNCYQNFQGGAISWTPTTGAHYTAGNIRETWRRANFEHGVMGYPIADEVCDWTTGNTNCYQNFQGGAISWTPTTGAHYTAGNIRETWRRANFEHGVMGYPIADEVCDWTTGNTNCYQNFQGGAISWTPTTGAHYTAGNINTTWWQVGSGSSILRYPTADEVCDWTPRNINCYQNFQGGAISWTPTTGAQPTWGRVREVWRSLGFEHGLLGYPTSAEQQTATGTVQHYQHGTITWNRSTDRAEAHIQ
jgi:hypothetical protein